VPVTLAEGPRAATVLVVDDNLQNREVAEGHLVGAGYAVVQAEGGIQALSLIPTLRPDLVLLDVLLPRLSGLDVCRELRQHSSVPIIMVTARTGEIDTVVGLEIGADDYVAKPFRLRELIARIRAALRRAPREAEDGVGSDVLEVSEIRLDPVRHEVTARGAPVRLTLKEFEVLELLLANAGRVLTRDLLIDRVWGADYVGDTKTLDVHVKRLREKVETDPGHPKLITTIRGLGYRFETSH
jgi:two-component system response regulator RegX3